MTLAEIRRHRHRIGVLEHEVAERIEDRLAVTELNAPQLMRAAAEDHRRPRVDRRAAEVHEVEVRLVMALAPHVVRMGQHDDAVGLVPRAGDLCRDARKVVAVAPGQLARALADPEVVPAERGVAGRIGRDVRQRRQPQHERHDGLRQVHRLRLRHRHGRDRGSERLCHQRHERLCQRHHEEQHHSEDRFLDQGSLQHRPQRLRPR